MKLKLLLVTVLVSAACGGGAPRQQPAPAAGPEAFVQPTHLPIYALLGFRQELNLTSQQVEALDSIAQQLQERNRGPAQRLPAPGAYDPRVEIDTAAVREIRTNRQVAAEAVRDVLSPEQQQRVCEIYARRQTQLRDGRGAPPAARQQPRRAGQGRAAQQPVRVGPTWPWCSPPAPAS
jgi:Spy/CpxP family protein refolding chaperone